MLAFRRIYILAALVATTMAIASCGSSNRPAATASATRASASTVVRTTALTHGDPAKVVIRIGDKPITLGFIRHWVAISSGSTVNAPEPPRFQACVEFSGQPAAAATPEGARRLQEACLKQYLEALGPAVSALIHTEWLNDEAASQGVRADQARLVREASPNGPDKRELEQIGGNPADLKFKLMSAQLSHDLYRKLEHNIPPVTQQLVRDYYEQHKASYRVPELRDLNILRAASEEGARQAKKEVEAGTSFATLAQRTTLRQPTHNGLLRGMKPEQFGEPVINKAIFHAPLKALRGPVYISLGFYIFEVLRIIPPRQQTLAEVAPEISQHLHEAQHDRFLAQFAAALKRKWTARTNCSPGYVVEYCRQYKPGSTGEAQPPSDEL